MLYDIFICHAFEDKKTFVRPLAESLRERNVEVWYDEFTLKLGDSIRRSLDKGLSKSRFGLVVLSKAFFEKQWPQYELDGLTEREIKGKEKIILPIWHDVSHNDVMKYSPSLAGKKAISSREGIEKVVNAILEVTHPQESPLIAARDILIEWGLTPPVITDQQWLEIVEASNRVPGYGAYIPEESHWGRWSFPLPPKEDGGKKMGERLAWTAMQMKWVDSAEKIPISPLTHPQEVLRYIHSHPGLLETCLTFPTLLAEYAPQLTIPGLGGDLEEDIEKAYEESCQENEKNKVKKHNSGPEIMTSSSPMCNEEFAFRHPTFCGYGASRLANLYFSGSMFGPQVSPYEHADHLIWLFSEASSWLPEKIHSIFIEGMESWGGGVWLWWDCEKICNKYKWDHCGALAEALYDPTGRKKFKWSKKLETDLINRIELSAEILNLSDQPTNLMKRMLDHQFFENFITNEKQRKKRKKG